MNYDIYNIYNFNNEYKYSKVLFEEIVNTDIKYNNSNLYNRLLIDSKFKDFFIKKICKRKCVWFNRKEEEITKCIPYHNLHYIKKDSDFFNDILHYKSNTTEFTKFKSTPNILDILKDKSLLQNKINNLINANNDSSTVKSKITKLTKKSNNLGKTIKSFTYEIFPNNEQVNTIHRWFDECDVVYNHCIQLYENRRTNNEYFDLNYKKSKLDIFNTLYKDTHKPAPYDILTDEVRSFCSNLKSCITNRKNGNIAFYKFKPKNRYYGRSILIPKPAINKSGFYPTLLNGPILGFDNINTNLLECDCRLIYDKYLNKYYLKCPMYTNIKEIENRKETVALDPGERIFMSYYSFNDCGMIGYDIRTKILKYQTKIKQIQRIISKNKNKSNNKIKNKSRLIRKLKKYYLKIKYMVKELHNKTALYLVKNYKQILIPKFETQSMIGKTFIKNELNKIKLEPIEKQKVENRKLTKKVRLSRSVKFVLNSLSHYSFKQHLLHKGKEYGCDVKIVTEEYTSKCCSHCGYLSDNYSDRQKKCPYCKLEINRDLNGSRNILIKNHSGNYK